MFCNSGSKEIWGALYKLDSVFFMDNREIHDLHLFSVSILWALPLKAYCIARIYLLDSRVLGILDVTLFWAP